MIPLAIKPKQTVQNRSVISSASRTPGASFKRGSVLERSPKRSKSRVAVSHMKYKIVDCSPALTKLILRYRVLKGSYP